MISARKSVSDKATIASKPWSKAITVCLNFLHVLTFFTAVTSVLPRALCAAVLAEFSVRTWQLLACSDTSVHWHLRSLVFYTETGYGNRKMFSTNNYHNLQKLYLHLIVKYGFWNRTEANY